MLDMYVCPDLFVVHAAGRTDAAMDTANNSPAPRTD